MAQENNHLSVQGDLFYPKTNISSQKKYPTLNEDSCLAAIEACERHFFPFGKPEVSHKSHNIVGFMLQWIRLNVEEKSDKNNSIFSESAREFFLENRGKIREAQVMYRNLVALFIQSKAISSSDIDAIKGSSIDKLQRLLEINDTKDPVN